MDSLVKKKARQVMVNHPASGSKSYSPVKASPRRLGASTSLRQLEALHKSSGTDSHLRIPDGKRIKLSHDLDSDSVQHASRTTKNRPKFDVDFSVLQDEPVIGGTCLVEVSDSDELPEPHELVRASVRGAGEADGGLASRASDYSDSDMDALIRDAHLGSIASTGIDSTKAQDISMSEPTRWTPECKGRKDDRTVTIATRTTSRATPSAGTTSPRLRPQVRMYGRLEFHALIND
jgi:hypothetical protein